MMRIPIMAFLLCSAISVWPDNTVPSGMPDVLTSAPPTTHHINIKANGLVWLTMMPNIEVDYQLTDKLSAGTSILWCPWFISDRHAVRVLGFQPSIKYWIKYFGNGSFISPHISLAWYNVKHGSYRYQDNSMPALGIGVAYGYSLTLSKKLNMEFSVGCGYLSLRYDRFYNVDNGSLVDTRRTSYFGIDHVGISLSYKL